MLVRRLKQADRNNLPIAGRRRVHMAACLRDAKPGLGETGPREAGRSFPSAGLKLGFLSALMVVCFWNMTATAEEPAPPSPRAESTSQPGGPTTSQGDPPAARFKLSDTELRSAEAEPASAQAGEPESDAVAFVSSSRTSSPSS